MLNGLLTSALSCPKTQTQPNSLIQQNAKILAATGSYDPRMGQDLQKMVAVIFSTLQGVLTVSRTTLQQKIAETEINLLEEKGQPKSAKGEVRAPQQQTASTKVANLAATPSNNETRVQQESSSKDSPIIYVGERITHSETLDDTLLYQDDAQCTLASSKNGAEDSADQDRRSKTYRTASELEKIRDGEDSISFDLMNYFVTSYSLDEEADQKPIFSSTGFELELNNGRRYAVDLSDDNKYSLNRSPSYSVNNLPSSFSSDNTMGWLMRLFQEVTDTALEVAKILGQKLERKKNDLQQLIEVNNVIRAALGDTSTGDWQWGDEKGVPLEKYRKAFQILKEQGVKLDGLDVEEWLKKQSKEMPPPDAKQELWNHLAEKHEYKPCLLEMAGLYIATPLTLSMPETQAKKIVGCVDYEPPTPEQGHPGWVTNGALQRLSRTIDDATVERNDANSKLQGQVSNQMQLYQGFQTAVINIGYMIAELMKSAFVKIPI